MMLGSVAACNTVGIGGIIGRGIELAYFLESNLECCLVLELCCCLSILDISHICFDRMCWIWMHEGHLVSQVQIRRYHAMGIVLHRIHSVGYGGVGGGMLVQLVD